MTLRPGHVVTLRRGGAGIVCRMSGGDIWVVPVWGANGPPRHRSEVDIDDIAEIIACGLSLRYPVVRVHQAFRLPSRPHEILGVAPAALMIRIMAALRAEAESQNYEATMRFGHTDQCVRL